MPEHGPGPGRSAGRGTTPRAPRDLPGTVDASARETEHAARLLRYLRDLAQARRRPSRDLAGHDRVHWLADLPDDVYVETDAGPGDVLFSVPVIPLTPPVVLDEFDGWLALRNWYRVLRELAGQDVVLATGLLAWRPAVYDHLLNTPVRIVVDERTDRIDVVLAGPTSLRDRELLSGHPGYRPADGPAGAIRAGHGFGLNASVGDVLRAWCSAALSVPADVRDDWAPGDGGPSQVPRVSLAPALVVRPQGRRAVADYHAALLDRLSGGVPEGFARLVSPTAKPDVVHVPERDLDTVPDMVAELLGRGERVLVATSGATAAGALRAALPPGLAGLAVADPAAAGRAAEAILSRTDVPDPGELAERERAAARKVDEIAERLRDGADEEPVDPRERLRAEAPDLAWMPVRPGMPPDPPISRSEAAELVVLLAEETPERKARTGQRDIDPGALPSAAYVRTLIEAEAAAAERAERTKTDLSRRLREADVSVLTHLDQKASTVAAALRDLGLDGDPGGWNPADLAAQAFADALADRRSLIWARVHEMTARARWAEDALREISGHRIDLPDDADLRGLAASAEELRAYLEGGGSLKRGPLRSSAQRQAEPLLATVRVDGAPPTTPELLDLVHTDLLVRITCRELQYVWEAAGISFPADLPPPERIARFVRAHARLARIRDAMTAVNETREILERSGLGIPLGHPHQWHSYVTALRNALEGLGVSRAAADLDALRDSIGPVGDDDPPELQDALDAVDARDAAAYGRALTALAEARHERSRQLRCEELLARVRAVHPDLANLMIATDGDEAWRTRTQRWDEAWAAAYDATRRSVPAAERLRADLAERRLRDVRADLAAARAWSAVRAALPADPAAPSEIVPAWFLPLWRIPETLPPAPNSFDVVIVDGEHGAGAEALFLLWLAPRIVLVGPPGKELPPLEGPPPSTLLPPHLRGITPTTPLFTALTAEPPEIPHPADTAPDPGLPASPPPAPSEPRAEPRTKPPTRPPVAPEAGTAPRAPERPPSAPPAPVPRLATRNRPPHARPPEPPTAPRRETPSEAAPETGPARPPRRPDAPQWPLPPRRLDAPRRDAHRVGGTLAGTDATTGHPGTGRDAGPSLPPRGLDAPGRVRRDPAEPSPPPSRPEIPALWGTPGAPPRPRPEPHRDRTPPARPEHSPPRRPPERPDQRPAEQRPVERRPAQGRAPEQRRPEQPAPERREPGQSLSEQRLSGRGAPERGPREQRSPGHRVPERRHPDRRPAERRPAEPRPPEGRPAPRPPERPRQAPAPRPAEPADQRPQPPLRPESAQRPEPARPREQDPERRPSRPERAPEPAPSGPVKIRRGQSIATYKRSELVQLVGRIAEREADLSDDQIIELVTRLLGCPEDESLLVGARLRYAVRAYREQAGRGNPEQ